MATAPVGSQRLLQDAAAGVPEAVETATMLGIWPPPGGSGMPSQAPPGAGTPMMPMGPQSTMNMGPMGGGLVPPGRPQGLSAGDPTTVPNSIPIAQQFVEALRRR